MTVQRTTGVLIRLRVNSTDFMECKKVEFTYLLYNTCLNAYRAVFLYLDAFYEENMIRISW